MNQIIDFFYKNRIITLFVILEFICFSLIFKFNSYQGSAYFNSSNQIAGAVYNVKNNISYYFKLKKVNSELAEENTLLRQELIREKQKNKVAFENISDTSKVFQYEYTAARVINNSYNKFSNYFTLDKGSNHGLQPGMGVVTPAGVAGKIKACSGNFSTVVSLLHERWSLSTKIKRGNIDGICKWMGGDPTEADLLYVGKHHKVYLGDTLVTTGYSATFPEGMTVGYVKSVVDDGKKYIIKVRLATDYTAMSFVYVIRDKLKLERDSLETDVELTGQD